MKFLILFQLLLAAGVIYVVFLTDNSASDLMTTNSFKLVIKNPDSDHRPPEPKPPVKIDEEPKTPTTIEPETPEKPPVKPEEPKKSHQKNHQRNL